VRPFYSTRHNVAAAVLLIPLYLFAAIGYARGWRVPLVRLCAAVTVLHLGLVGLTFANWDGRFFLYVYPLFALVAAAGLVATWPTVARASA